MPSTIVWFRDDLRLDDNPALDAAAKDGAVLCLFVLDESRDGPRRPGAASRWWLHHSLEALRTKIEACGAHLVLRRGSAASAVLAVTKEASANRVVWNRRYALAERAQDDAIEARLRETGIDVATFNGHLLHEPDDIRSKTGTPMRVFTPFWKAALARGEPRTPTRAPKHLKAAARVGSDDLGDWKLLPTTPDWSGGIAATWTPGSAGAVDVLRHFLDGNAAGYGHNRNRPDRPATSRLSPHLHFGEISPFQVWHAARHADAAGDAPAGDIQKFLTELGWREFSYHLLASVDDIATVNVQRRFDEFPWRSDDRLFRAWTEGRTGYPLVDAGMRQLWQTGWMHNRIRMVTASFLIKHLMIDWRRGESWFWDTLVDADQANNPASWQWVAGSGADAAPYFRVFNPTLQGIKFDPKGDYVREFVPEIAGLPDSHIHDPSSAPAEVLAAANVELGKTYPAPIVDHAEARQRALAAFQSLKAAA